MFKSNCVIALLILQLVYSVGCYDKDFVTIKADDTYFDDGRKGFGLDQLYHLNSNTIKNHLGIIQRITIPESFKQKKLCWGSIYFTGIKNMEWKKSVPFIVADYDKEQPLFIVDHNSNFDFSDDSIIQVLPKNPFFVDLRNVNYLKAIFRVQLNFFNDNTQVFFDATDSSDRYRKPLPLNFLMQENRFNYRKVFLPDSNVITLHDSNCNGLYNDEEGWFESNSPDKILAGDISTSKSIELNPLKTKKIKRGIKLAFRNNTYSLREVEKTGAFIKVKPLNIASDSIEYLPEFFYHDKSEKKTFTLSGEKDFTVLHFWGVWCRGCIAGMPYVVKFESENKMTLDVYHLNYGDSKEILSRYMSLKNFYFSPLRIDTRNVENLGVYGYPNFIVLNKKREVVLRTMHIEEVMAFIKKYDK